MNVFDRIVLLLTGMIAIHQDFPPSDLEIYGYAQDFGCKLGPG